MQTAKKKNFLEWNNDVFVSSIKKIDLNIILIITLDAIFYFSAGYLAIEWLKRIQAKLFAFNMPQNIMSLGYDRAQQLVKEVQGLYYLIIISFILLLIAIIFLASILKGIIWAKTTNAKITFKLISKFFLLNLIWMGFWFAIILLISLAVELSSAVIFMAIALAIAFFLSNTVYTIFMKEQKLRAIIDVIKINAGRIHLFLLPYAVILLILYLIIRISVLIKFKFSDILLGIIIIIYIAVVRNYLSALVLDLTKPKTL